jgi:hypothetical protein
MMPDQWMYDGYRKKYPNFTKTGNAKPAFEKVKYQS